MRHGGFARRTIASWLFLLVTLVCCSKADDEGRSTRSPFRARDALSGADPTGYARALAPREFEFPVDHGPHPRFRTEWWYATGNLWTESGRRFGYQLTIFRNALRPELESGRESAWAVRDVWFAHFGLTDVLGDRLLGEERFARGGELGLAGARVSPQFEVWLEDWRFAELPREADADASSFGVRLRAAAADFAIDLELRAIKPLVRQGERGLSRKGEAPGNASYYYSFTRLATTGSIRVDGEPAQRVTGRSWIDREWSTGALAEEQVGWDWFALQLDDGREVMFYRLRCADGSIEPKSAGVLVDVDGRSHAFDVTMVQIAELASWRNDVGASYPIRWRFSVPDLALDFAVQAVVDDQEHATFVVRYWEGAVDVLDPVDESRLGVGYVEVTGR